MPPEVIIGPVLIVAGLAIIFFRRSISRILHRAIERMYGEPLADDWLRPDAAPTRLMMAGIFFVGFGLFVISDLLVN